MTDPIELLKSIAKTDAKTLRSSYKPITFQSFKTVGSRVDFIKDFVSTLEDYKVYITPNNNSIICIPNKNLENDSCKDVDTPMCVISSHMDTVKDKLPDVVEDGDTLIGYFDNAACNAACLTLMTDTPKDTIFVFTGGEENQNCIGLQVAYKYLTNVLGFSPYQLYGIATDVTYEGYRIPNCALTVENMAGSHYVTDDRLMLHNVYTVGDCRKIFKDLPHIPHKTLPDEGWIWSKLNHNISFSACLPVGEGDMHSKKNLTHLDKRVYRAYIDALYGLSIMIRGDEPCYTKWVSLDKELVRPDILAPANTFIPTETYVANLILKHNLDIDKINELCEVNRNLFTR